MGFAVPPALPRARWALTPPFHPYPPSLRKEGGLFSVALSSASPPPGVTWHRTLWSSDFPPVLERLAPPKTGDRLRDVGGRTFALRRQARNAGSGRPYNGG